MVTLVESSVTPVAVGDPETMDRSAVSWSAILVGAVAACALTLFLAEVAAGLGLVSVSPWSGQGVSGTTLHVAGGIGLVLMAIMASALGGYLAGRLRTKWIGIHSDETYFRDTAHGIAAWAVATLLTATVLASVTTAIVSGVAGGAAANPQVGNANAYFVDTLFRSDRPAQGDTQASTQEAARIMARSTGLRGELAGADRTRLGQLVAARTGLSQQEAEQRVDQVVTQAKAAADEARKAAAKLALWMAAAMLAGALSAGIAAVEGGRERDA